MGFFVCFRDEENLTQIFFFCFLVEYILNINIRSMGHPVVVEEKRINMQRKIVQEGVGT